MLVSTAAHGRRAGRGCHGSYRFLSPDAALPSTWSGGRSRPVPSSGVVVVGVDRSEVAKAALVFAAGEAGRRGSRLVVAHAGDLPKHSERRVEPFGESLSREAISTVAAVAPHVNCRVEVR